MLSLFYRRIFPSFFLLSLLVCGGPSFACDAYAWLANTALRDAAFANEGFEALKPGTLTENEAREILAALIDYAPSKMGGASLVEGKIRLSDEIRDAPGRREAVLRLEAYLTDVFLQTQAKLREISGKPNAFQDARVQVRWNADGMAHPSANDPGHVDGGHATVAVTLVGPGTVVMPADRTEVQAPPGLPVLMMGRIGSQEWKLPGTWHKPPSSLREKKARLFIQIVF